MPRYYFRVALGQFSGESDVGGDFAHVDAAWDEMRQMCGDLVGGVCRKLNQNGEWRMELLDESKKPVFRVALVAETLDPELPSQQVVAASQIER
jgi:hypothetical protein